MEKILFLFFENGNFYMEIILLMKSLKWYGFDLVAILK